MPRSKLAAWCQTWRRELNQHGFILDLVVGTLFLFNHLVRILREFHNCKFQKKITTQAIRSSFYSNNNQTFLLFTVLKNRILLHPFKSCYWFSDRKEVVVISLLTSVFVHIILTRCVHHPLKSATAEVCISVVAWHKMSSVLSEVGCIAFILVKHCRVRDHIILLAMIWQWWPMLICRKRPAVGLWCLKTASLLLLLFSHLLTTSQGKQQYFNEMMFIIF